ncbi:transposase [Paraliobacillus sp. JSM ZJ581]|uniref:transposase n=1 Tax=Paraliobacillus sp. JSM ZJ581 TaxID=3342118 RepID=UPI0035A8269E
MKEIFIRSLYKTIVQEGKSEYKGLLENTRVEDATDKYWISALQLYDNLTEENREKLMRVIELVMIDTISSMLGIIDGSSTLSGCKAEPKLYLDNIDTDNELQDLFSENVEEIEE